MLTSQIWTSQRICLDIYLQAYERARDKHKLYNIFSFISQNLMIKIKCTVNIEHYCPKCPYNIMNKINLICSTGKIFWLCRSLLERHLCIRGSWVVCGLVGPCRGEAQPLAYIYLLLHLESIEQSIFPFQHGISQP
jgi:hypothetical protein